MNGKKMTLLSSLLAMVSSVVVLVYAIDLGYGLPALAVLGLLYLVCIFAGYHAVRAWF